MAEWIELYTEADYDERKFFLWRQPPSNNPLRPRPPHEWMAFPPQAYPDPYYVKIGNPAQMKLLRGKVVRAFEISVRVRAGTDVTGSDPLNPSSYPLVMSFFGGSVGVSDPANPQRKVVPQLEWKMQRHPNPEYGWIGADLEQHTSHPDTTQIIGGFFDSPALGDVDQVGLYWPGGQSEVPFKAYQTAAGDPEPPRWGISAASVRVLVDDLPKVTVDIPSSVPVGGVVKGRIRIRYPSGDPVVGLPLGIGGFGQVSHRTIDGTWGRDAFFNTDENGEAHFELRGEYASNTYVQIVIRGVANEWANWYDPPLSNYTHQIMVTAPPGEPQPEGDCYTIPADPGQSYIPPSVDLVPQAAWDAGANSETELEGDVSLRFTMRQATGVVLGLTNDRENVTDRARITHGFYFTSTANGRWQAQVMEAAKAATSARGYDEETLFEVRRVAGAVTYWVDGEPAHSSRVPSTGQVSVGTALYATGDTAPPFGVPPAPPAPGGWVDIPMPWFGNGAFPAPSPYTEYDTDFMGAYVYLPEEPPPAGFAYSKLRLTGTMETTTSGWLTGGATVGNDWVDFPLFNNENPASISIESPAHVIGPEIHFSTWADDWRQDMEGESITFTFKAEALLSELEFSPTDAEFGEGPYPGTWTPAALPLTLAPSVLGWSVRAAGGQENGMGVRVVGTVSTTGAANTLDLGWGAPIELPAGGSASFDILRPTPFQFPSSAELTFVITEFYLTTAVEE